MKNIIPWAGVLLLLAIIFIPNYLRRKTEQKSYSRTVKDSKLNYGKLVNIHIKNVGILLIVASILMLIRGIIQFFK